MNIYRTPIEERKEFKFEDDILKMLKEYPDHWYIYERYHRITESDNYHLVGYELIKAKKAKQPDGKIIYIYPSSEDFGRYGWYFPKKTSISAMENIIFNSAKKDSRKC